MNLSDETQLSEMLTRYVGGDCTAEEARELSARLESDPAACDLLAEILTQGVAVREFVQSHPEPVQAVNRMPQRWLSWFQWRPLTAAAAGLVIGLFSASMVFAYGMPKVVHRVLALANAGFEERVAPLPDGIPVRYGVWSGDHAELVSEQQGIVPHEGKHMFRFLRSDSKQVSGGPPFNGNIYQLIDARVWRDVINSGTAVVDWSAWFNCVREVPGTPSTFEASVWAFAGDPSFVRKNWEQKLHQELAYSSWRVVADDDPQSWQRIAGSMIVPPDTDFLVIELKVLPEKPVPVDGAVTFAGHYADDVQLILRTNSRQQVAKLNSTKR